MNEDQRETTLDEQRDVPRQIAWASDAVLGKLLGEPALDGGFVTARRRPRRMPRQVGELHRDPGEARSLPRGLLGPGHEFGEDDLDRGRRIAGSLAGSALDAREHDLVLDVEHGGQERVLALIVIVERALRDPGGLGDGIHAGSREAVPVEEVVRSFEDPPLSSRTRASSGVAAIAGSRTPTSAARALIAPPP